MVEDEKVNGNEGEDKDSKETGYEEKPNEEAPEEVSKPEAPTQEMEVDESEEAPLVGMGEETEEEPNVEEELVAEEVKTEKEATDAIEEWDIYSNMSDERKETFNYLRENLTDLDVCNIFSPYYEDENIGKKLGIFMDKHKEDNFEGMSTEDVTKDFDITSKSYDRHPDVYDDEPEEESEDVVEMEEIEEEDEDIEDIQERLKELSPDIYTIGAVEIDMRTPNIYDGSTELSYQEDEEGFKYFIINTEVMDNLFEAGFMSQAVILTEQANRIKNAMKEQDIESLHAYLEENVSDSSAELLKKLLASEDGYNNEMIGRVLEDYHDIMGGINQMTPEDHFKSVEQYIRDDIVNITTDCNDSLNFVFLDEDGSKKVYNYGKDIKPDILKQYMERGFYKELHDDLVDSISTYKMMIEMLDKDKPFWWGNEKKKEDAEEILDVFEKLLPYAKNLMEGRAEFPKGEVKEALYKLHLAEAMKGRGMEQLGTLKDKLKEDIEDPAIFVLRYKVQTEETDEGSITTVPECSIYMIDGTLTGNQRKSKYIDVVDNMNRYEEEDFDMQWGMLEDTIYSVPEVVKNIEVTKKDASIKQ